MSKEYIEREAALKAMSQASWTRTWSMDDSDVMEKMFTNVEELPAADVAPVIHGEWIKHVEKSDWINTPEVWYRCSICGRAEDFKEPYCNCGARMDGGNKQ